jgi:AraC-like DNA-binding protein
VVTVNLRGKDQARWLEARCGTPQREANSPQPGAEGVLGLWEVRWWRRCDAMWRSSRPSTPAGSRACATEPSASAWPLMHEKPTHPWTVDSLAREVGTSRSVLAERFTHFVGQSPMQYLGRWRMALATNYLRRSSLNLARIAEEAGYETDAAFSRAFRREFGVPPATWRRMHAGNRLSSDALQSIAGSQLSPVGARSEQPTTGRAMK